MEIIGHIPIQKQKLRNLTSNNSLLMHILRHLRRQDLIMINEKDNLNKYYNIHIFLLNNKSILIKYYSIMLTANE